MVTSHTGLGVGTSHTGQGTGLSTHLGTGCTGLEGGHTGLAPGHTDLTTCHTGPCSPCGIPHSSAGRGMKKIQWLQNVTR